MSCRQSELGLDAAAIRSIWETGYLPSKGFGASRNFADLPNQRNLPPMASERRSATAFGPVGSPVRKKSLGAYDCSSGSLFSNKQNNFSLTPKRSSVPSLWDYSSGYSSGELSPLFSSENCSDYGSDYSPPSRGSSSLFDSLDQPHERDNEKEQLNMIANAISSLLMTRGNSISDRVDRIKELFSLTTAESRRASVATSGGHFLERERRVNGGLRAEGYSSMFRNDFNRPLNGAPVYPHGQQNSNDIILENIEREAKMRRTSAYQSETTFVWEGTLPTRFRASPTYASKVFVGGLPYDVTPDALTELFGKFGLVTVQFPPRGRGHAYLVFDTEQQVQALLNACENKGPGQYFFWVSSRRGKDRQAQVIPWAIEDSDWLAPSEPRSDSLSSCLSSSLSSSSSVSSDSVEILSESELGGLKSHNVAPKISSPKNTREQNNNNNNYKQNTVFVGALHGEITAEGLQEILSKLFGQIAHVGIDTDRAKYPNGSGRVTFKTRESFRQAVLAEFVQVVTPRFSKIIQLDAYIEDGTCTDCRMSTPIFCRHPSCFCYYCPLCFEEHRREKPDYHPPVMRNRNNGLSSSLFHSSGSCRLNKDRSQTI